MKSKRRLISLLLVVAILASIAIIAVSADGAVKITNIGSTGNLAGIPSVVPAGNITYLSDIYNTSAKVYSYVVPGGNGQVRDFALDQNFFGTRVYAFTANNDSNRFGVLKGDSKVDADGYRTLNNGVKVHYSDIVLGRNTTIFEKGLAFQPSTKGSANQATVIFDIRNLDADYFYAVAGMTGEGNKCTYSDRKLTYEVYGSKDTAYSETGMTFEKLAYAESIRAFLMGEFNVPVSGYNYLKLVAVSTGTSTSAAESVWADACVYKAPTTSANVSISWDDTYNPTAIRPDGDLTAQLYADGVAVDGKTATLNAGNNWSASWADLAKYQDDLSTEIVYTAVLTEDPALHRLVSSANGVMTYQYDATLTTKDIPISLTWNDENASGRAEQVVVQLYADGAAQTGKAVTLSADNNWSATFKDLPEKKRISATETADIAYTFKVTTRVKNYISSIADSEGSIVVTMTYSASNAQKFSNIGMSGTLDGIPAEATGSNTHYLTDMLNGRNKKVVSQYIADGGKYKSFENYDGKVQIFTGGTKQHLIENADTVVNSVTYQPTDIALGANGTVYSEGLSFEVSAPTADDTYITYNLTGMNATNFYAVAGITDAANDIMTKPFFLTFEVWGSKDGTTYEKLGYAEELRSYLVAEFNVDITGYNYLKLTAYNTGDLNEGISAVWADALVYCASSGTTPTPPQPTDPTEPTEPGDDLTDSGDVDTSTPIGYTPSSDGTYAGITKAAEGSYVALSDAKYVGDSYILPSSSNPNRTVRIDTTDLNANTPSNAIIGKANAKFAQHLTLHPTEKSNSTYAFVELDLTGLDVDRFYSAVGIAAANGKTGGMGVIFNVFGYDETKADYVLIGTSSDVHGYESGEFDIDITGYKKLKLEVALTADSADHYSRTSSWCDIAVYKYDENGSAPETPDEGGDELPGVYTHSSSGSYKWISDAKGGNVTYLSKLTYTSSSNSSAGNPTTKNEPYGEAGKKIIIGEKNTGFTYGLGVHPKSGSAQAYTIYDLTGLDVDRFYSAVGITNEKGKSGSSKGVIFQVYADFDGSGTYKLLAESNSITKKGSGEFHVDISGAKSLKLVTLSATGDHASSASAWGAACVYKYDANGSRPTSYTTVGASNAAATKSDNTGLKHTDGFTPSADGEYTGVDSKHIGSVVYLSDLQYLDASNTTNSANPNGQPTTLDHPYNDKASLIIIGENEQAFFKGLGVHPKSPSAPVNDSIQSWTTYDVSELNADRFYAAVGLTNDKGKEGASKGVIFRVYADYSGNGSYKELAHSGCLDGRDSGEFDLDITGAKTLMLTVEAASSTHASSASAWANACVYDSNSITEGVGKPEIKEPSVKPTEPTEVTEPADLIPGENDSKTSVGLVIGIVILCLLLLAVILLAILLILRKRKARN